MKDKKFIRYRVGIFDDIRPSSFNYRTKKEAIDAAERFARKEKCTYYVFEVCEVVNTIKQISY